MSAGRPGPGRTEGLGRPPGPRGALRPAGTAALAAVLALAPVAACEGGGAAGGARSDGPAGQQRDTAAAGDTSAAPVRRGPELTVIQVGGHEVKVEVADDEAERRQGLMNRDSLPEDQGMLFVYPDPRTLSFWMRDTDVPLDIAFIDRQGFILNIEQMEPHTEELHRSSGPAVYALEMNQGWFEAHGVEAGDRVRF